MIKHYDIVISLGEFCLASWALRYCHIQKESMPLDWSGWWNETMAGKAGLSGKVNLICSQFQGAFELSDLELLPGLETNTQHANVRNLKTGLQYLHDFPLGVPIAEYYPEYRDKYERRVNRFYETINQSDKILFFFLSRSEGITDSYILEQSHRLRAYFRAKKIDFLYITHDEKMQEKRANYKMLDEGIHRYTMNVCYSPEPPEHPDWVWGNRDLYNAILKNYCYSTYTKEFFSSPFSYGIDESDCIYKNIIELSCTLKAQNREDISVRKRAKKPSIIKIVKRFGYSTLQYLTFGKLRMHCNKRALYYKGEI